MLRKILLTGFLVSSIPMVAFAASDAVEEKLYFDDRLDIPPEYRWDLTLQFADVQAWNKTFTEVETGLPAIAKLSGKVTASPENMAAALRAQFSLYQKMWPLYVNAKQKVDLDGNDMAGAELAGRASSLAGQVSEAVSFIEPEIAQLPAAEAAEFLRHPALQEYSHYLDNIWRLREHYRSPEVEEVLAGSSLSGRGHRSAYDSLTNTDIEWPTIKDEKGEDVVVAPGQFFRFQISQDRDLRQRSFEAHLGTIAKYKNTLAATLAAKIQQDAWLARVYRYPSALDAALASTNVPPEVMATLLSAVHDNVDKIQGYADLRRRILGLEELHPWDRHVALLPSGGRKYSFHEGWQLAIAFWRETYGEEYAAIAQQALDQRWIDVYSNKGKRDGAYSWGTYQAPVYLLLNWEGEFDDVSTLVHEMGHSVHGVLADQNQAYHHADSDIFVSEVGSVASESLFVEWMLERTDDPQERKLLIDHALTSIRGTFVTQIFFHEWEARAHAMAENGEALTAESMGQAYVELSNLYNGDSMVDNPLQEVYWARISHFYRNFYVWKYATSFAAGEALAARFRSGDKSAAADYLAMLKLGGSVYPLDVLKRGGVDMTDPAVIQAVMNRFGELQEQLAREFGL